MARAYYAIALLFVGMLVCSVALEQQLVGNLHGACAMESPAGVQVTTPLEKACADDKPGGLSAIQAIEQNIGPVGIPWYAYALFALSAIMPILAQRNRFTVLAVALAGVAFFFGIRPAFTTGERLNSHVVINATAHSAMRVASVGSNGPY